MNNLFISSLIAILIFNSCKEKNKTTTHLDKIIVGKPFIPAKITWFKLDSNYNEHEDLFSKCRTLFIANDSIVYMFDCLSNKKLNCTDTSIFDKANNIYNDTVVCNYEDSILFGVENVEMYRGSYQTKEGGIVCKMKKITNEVSTNKDLAYDEFTDTLKVSKKNNQIILLYKNQEYVEAINFKKESYKRLLQYIKLE